MDEVRWFKLTTTIFDDEKVKIIESMPERDTIFYLWVKLICLATRNYDSGRLYLADGLAYSDETLASVMGRPVNTIRLALATFEKLKMIQWLPDGALFLPNLEKHQNLDALELYRLHDRDRQRKFRKRHNLPLLQACNVTVTENNVVEEEEEEEEDKRKRNIEKEYKEKEIQKINKILEKEEFTDEEARFLGTFPINDGNQNLRKVVEILRGAFPALKANKEIYAAELERLGIRWNNGKEEALTPKSPSPGDTT